MSRKCRTPLYEPLSKRLTATTLTQGRVVLLEPNDPASYSARQEIYDGFCGGESLAALAFRSGSTPSLVRRIVREMRAERIRELPLSYIPNRDFERPQVARTILAPMPALDYRTRAWRVPKNIPAYLASLYEVPLLTAAQERHLFRKFNFLKYRAAQLRGELEAAGPDRLMDQIERLYAEAISTKNAILRANLRLVVSIAKRYTLRPEQFFDLVSDGNMSLIRAVEKFDFARGNKFSTYASWAIKKNYARSHAKEVRHQDHYRTSLDEVLTAKTEYRADPHEQETAQKRREHDVGKLLACLDERERQVITSRFGLVPGCRPLTLKEVGVQFGVSKERIRQIEARALQKLQRAARLEHVDSQLA